MDDPVIVALNEYLKGKKLTQALQATMETMNRHGFPERDRITRYYDTEVTEKFIKVLGRPLTRNEVFMLNTLSGELNKEIINTKRFFNVPRPFVIIPNLPYIPVIGPASPSFPSGHAAGYRLLQSLFTAIDPKNKDAYRIIMLNGANSRIIGGVHTPTDIEGGFIVSDMVFSKNG